MGTAERLHKQTKTRASPKYQSNKNTFGVTKREKVSEMYLNKYKN